MLRFTCSRSVNFRPLRSSLQNHARIRRQQNFITEAEGVKEVS